MPVVLVVLLAAAQALAGSLGLELRNAEGEQVLNGILSDTAFWAGADIETYQDRLYDEIRLKRIESGYVPWISGEGKENFDHEVVADIVFFRNTDLPKYMAGAKAVVMMGSGYDPVVGAEYRDCFYVLDLTAFYAHFPQRMYRKRDAEANRTVLWFEKLDARFVDAATWGTYQAKMQSTLEGLETRWMFGSIVEVDDVYGMFVVSPGAAWESRVSFVSKLTFGEDAGWIARAGSNLPFVLKAGLKSGFGASVAIAQHEKQRRAARAQPATPPAIPQ